MVTVLPPRRPVDPGRRRGDQRPRLPDLGWRDLASAV